MILSNKKNEKYEFQVRNIGGSDVFYKRKIGDKLWGFSNKEEFELNKNIMNKKYSEFAINKGTEIELEHAETIKKFMRDGVSVKEVARAIAIDHLEESPTYYQDLKEEYSRGGNIDNEFSEMKSLIDKSKIEDINNYEYSIQYHSLYKKLKKVSSELGEWDSPKLTKEVEDIIKDKFYEELKKRVSLVDGKIRLFRSIKLKDINSIDVENLGVYWAYSYDFAEVFNDMGYEHNEKDISKYSEYVIKADFNLIDVDWSNTLDLYIMSEFGEGEIRLKKDAPAYNLQIQKRADEKWLNINKELSLGKMFKAENGGVIKKENLARIYCHNPKCNWNWSVESGGDDLYVCHKCNTDNEKFYENGGLIAPNGKPSNLTPEQYKLVRTPAFKEWFGDWENDPVNASKVIDKETKEPLLVYHGTNNDFTIFDKSKLGSKNFFAESSYLGFFFASNIKTSEAYTGMNTMDMAGVSFGAYDDVLSEYQPKMEDIQRDIKKVNEEIYEKYKKEELDKAKEKLPFEKIRDAGFTEEEWFKFQKEYAERHIDWNKISEIAKKENDSNGNNQKYNELKDLMYNKIEEKWRVKTNSNPRIIKLFLNIREPHIVDYENNDKTELSFDIKNAIEYKKDGVIFNNLRDGADVDDIFVAFESNQIKLADGTNTTFNNNNPDIRFDDGGDTSKNADDKLVALHNISAGQIISANKLGGLVTPSIAILKAGQKFTDFGSITLIPNKELINPKNYDVKVFAGDVYSPTVPRRLFYVDKKKYENVTLKIINKSYNYDKNHEVYNIVSNLFSDYNDFFKDLGKMSFDELNKYYYDKMKVVYIVDKDIPIKIPMKESKHFLWNNVDFTLTEEQKKRFAPILKEYTKQSNEFGSAGVSKDVLSNVYDLFIEVLDGVKLDLKQQYKDKGEQGDLLYEMLIKNLEESFEKYVGTRYSWFGHSEYKLSQAVFGKQELDEKKLDANIKKIFTKSVIIDYKQWLSDFISQFRGSAYFLKGNEKTPYTLDNLVDATSYRVVGQEKNITFGVNQAKSFSTKQLKSFEEIKKDSKNLISKEEMNIIDESNKNDFFKLSEYLDYEYSNTWGKLDSLGKALADYFKGNSAESSLRKNDFKSPNIFQKETFITFAKKLKDSPVDYFEAKFQRAVKLDEFEYAIIPYDTEKEALDILKNNGLKIKKYKTDEERVELTNSVVFKDKKLTFKDGGNVLEDKTIYVNSNHGKIPVVLEKHWQDDTELVPVYELKRFREFNRYERPKYNLKDSSENISKLEKEILENGINEPLIIEYSLSDNSVLLIEGNHRLNVAENLGIDYFPARVVLRRSEFPSHKQNNSLKVKGFKPDEYGYVPSNLKPSQVGIFETKKAFEQGGIVEGQLHSECNAETGCGEKYDVGGIGHIIEVERDEAVIVSKAFQDENNYEIKGTPSEIASAVNVIGGGMNFDSGAEIKTEDGEKIKIQEIKKEAINTDVETIEPNSVIINRRSMYDENEYIAKGTPKQIASQINNLNNNGVKITDGGSIKKA